MLQNSRKPKPGWRQLNFKYMMCVPTAKCAAILFIILFAISLIFGSVLLSTSYSIVEYRKRYDDICPINSDCTVEINIEDSMTSPVFIYYELHNYYQNHRKYVKSSCQLQLAGEKVSADDCELCDPLIKVKDYDYPLYNLNGQQLNKTQLANPCGLIAASLFNDTFALKKDSEIIDIDSSDIAWFTDNTNKYKNRKDYKEVQFLDVEKQHFKVWMRTAATSTFRKLYGKIDKNLKHAYNVTIHNLVDVSEFDGEKWIILSTISTFGGKNLVLGWSFISVAVVSLIWAFVFIWLGKNIKPVSIEDRFKKLE